MPARSRYPGESKAAFAKRMSAKTPKAAARTTRAARGLGARPTLRKSR